MIIISGNNKQTICNNLLKVVSGLYNGNIGKDSNGCELLDNDTKNNTYKIKIKCKRILFLSFDLITYKFYKEFMRNINIPYLIHTFENIDIRFINTSLIENINNIYYYRNKKDTGLIELYRTLNVFNVFVDLNGIFDITGSINYINYIRPIHFNFNQIIINELNHNANITLSKQQKHHKNMHMNFCKYFTSDACVNFIRNCYKKIDTKHKNDLNPISFIIPPSNTDIDSLVLLKQSVHDGNEYDVNNLFCTMCFISLSSEFDIFFMFENKNNHVCVCCECMYELKSISYADTSIGISIDIKNNTYTIDKKTNNIYISPLNTNVENNEIYTYIDKLYIDHYLIYYYIMCKRKNYNIKQLKINIFK